MKSAKRWMGWLAAGLAVLATGSAGGAEETGFQFRGGHPWLSRDRAIVIPNGEAEETYVSDAAPYAKGNQRAVSSGNIHALSGAAGRYFDITIAMYNHRDATEREKINRIITNFAKGVYEMTEGKHFLGHVRIFENPGNMKADIHWTLGNIQGGRIVNPGTEFSFFGNTINRTFPASGTIQMGEEGGCFSVISRGTVLDRAL